jgi:hypothetical protein
MLSQKLRVFVRGISPPRLKLLTLKLGRLGGFYCG